MGRLGDDELGTFYRKRNNPGDLCVPAQIRDMDLCPVTSTVSCTSGTTKRTGSKKPGLFCRYSTEVRV